MGNERFAFLDRFGLSQTLRRWTRAVEAPALVSARDLSTLHAQMRATRDRIDNLAIRAESELLLRAQDNDGIERPDQCDWAERPAPSLRQDPVPPGLRGPAFGLVFEVYRFDGSFLSLVQDLPPVALQGLTLNHYIGVHLRMAREHPVEVYARLNVQHGPNQEQMVRQIDFRDDVGRAEFDLAYSKINEKRIEKAWLDLILEGPEMNRLAIWDMVLLRAPRADI